MAGFSDDQAVDYYYQDDLYLEHPDEKFSCPICLCPVQREAHLTECCGRHFCLCCIGRLRNERKPCPMCKSAPLAIFPNKERQREIKQIRVRCPLSLAQYRGVVVSGRGQETTKSDAGEKSATTYEEKDFKATEECQIENQGGFSNTTDASEVTILSEIVDHLKLSDNDNSTKHEKLSQVDSIKENHTNEVAKPELSADHAKDSDTAAAINSTVRSCEWIGELGQVENHVSDVHGAEALKRIKHDDNDSTSNAEKSATGNAHHVHEHHHHHHGHSNVHVLRSYRCPQHGVYHAVRTQGGVSIHYHWPNSPPQPFNVSNTTAASPSNDVVSDFYSSHQPSGHGVRAGSENREAARVSSANCSTASSDGPTGITRGSGPPPRQIQQRNSISSMPRLQSNLNLEPNTSTGSPSTQVSTGGQNQRNTTSSSPTETEQQVHRVHIQSGRNSASEVDGQQQSSSTIPPEQFVVVSGHFGGQPGQQIVQLVRPALRSRGRGCPYRYHMRGMHGHHHHHHHHHHGHHHGSLHFHHQPPPPGPPHHTHPPPPPHGPPPHPHHPPHRPPPPRGFPPGPGRGGHPRHHHHHHHPHGRHRGCHGHHHHPPPY